LCFGSDATLTGCTITGNSASDNGGGIYCNYNSGATLSDCTISGNSASNEGGGIYCSSSPPTLSDCELTLNTATLGGAIWIDGGGGSFEYCSFTHNDADSLGDAFFTADTTLPIHYCNFFDNGWAMHNADPVAVPQASENWWGHSTGPWHSGYNPFGEGDSLFSYSWDFQPWLAAADTIAPPFPPRSLIQRNRDRGSVDLAWEALPLSDLGGYCIHFDLDSLGYDYENFVDVGNVTEATLGGLETGLNYRVAVSSYDMSGNHSSPGRSLWLTAEAVAAPDGAPSALTLAAPYPNPFNPKTSLSFSIDKAGPVRLAIYDTSGRQVALLLNEALEVGRHDCSWDGQNKQGQAMPSGLYLARLQSGKYSESRKLLLAK
jgi:parallel beta-helix repeat protein